MKRDEASKSTTVEPPAEASAILQRGRGLFRRPSPARAPPATDCHTQNDLNSKRLLQLAPLNALMAN